MPLFFFGVLVGWLLRTPNKPAYAVQLGTARVKLPKPRVTIGPAVLTDEEVNSLPLAVRSPSADAKLIASAAKQAGLKLPSAAAAKKSAQSVADDVRMHGPGYDVHAVQAYQLQAGLKNARGSYTPETISSLRKMGAKNVPTKVYTRAATAPYAVKG